MQEETPYIPTPKKIPGSLAEHMDEVFVLEHWERFKGIHFDGMIVNHTAAFLEFVEFIEKQAAKRAIEADSRNRWNHG